jgi:hypothetical protein
MSHQHTAYFCFLTCKLVPLERGYSPALLRAGLREGDGVIPVLAPAPAPACLPEYRVRDEGKRGG